MTVLANPRLDTRPETGARRLAGQVCTLFEQAFGWLFVATLVVGTAYFPWMKGMLIGYVPIIAGVVLALGLMHPGCRTWLNNVLMRGSPTRFAWWLIGLAIVVRAVPVMVWGLPPVSDHAVYHGRAIQMLNGHGYGPTAFFAPGMSFWLLSIYTLVGPSVKGALLVNAVLGGLFSGLTLAVGRRIVPEAAARLAGLMTACFPSFVVYAMTLGNDVLIGVLLFAAVLMFLRGAAARHTGWYVGLLGATLGVLSFVKPIGLLLPVVFGLAYWRRGTSAVRSGRNVALMSAGMLLVLAPWIARNYLLFDAFIPVTTSGGAALWMTNHPDATPLTERIPEFPPGTSEIEVHRRLWRASWAHILAHPDHFARMLLPKFAYQWGTSSSVMATVSYDRWNPYAEAAAKGVINVAWGALVVLFSVAVTRDGFRRSGQRFWPILALLAYLWGVHLFFEPQSRYHLPLLPAMFIPAAAALLRNPARSEPDAPALTPSSR